MKKSLSLALVMFVVTVSSCFAVEVSAKDAEKELAGKKYNPMLDEKKGQMVSEVQMPLEQMQIQRRGENINVR